MAMPEQFTGGQVGLILSSCMILMGQFQFGVRQTTELETQMVAVERVLEYGEIPSEGALQRRETKPSQQWPQKGEVQFRHVNLTYRRSSTPVLKDICLKVTGGAKVGIVGRTGAGKSSLIGLLFRLVEFDGLVSIDGVDIKSLGLHDLREKIAIIPQDPILFSGTIRSNLDPFKEYNDHQIWDILRSVKMHEMILSMDGQLDAQLTSNGGNLSVGQRQFTLSG